MRGRVRRGQSRTFAYIRKPEACVLIMIPLGNYVSFMLTWINITPAKSQKLSPHVSAPHYTRYNESALKLIYQYRLLFHSTPFSNYKNPTVEIIGKLFSLKHQFLKIEFEVVIEVYFFHAQNKLKHFDIYMGNTKSCLMK